MALKCQALKQYGVSVSENPENLIGRIEEINNEMADKVPNEVSYKIWKQVQVEEKKKNENSRGADFERKFHSLSSKRSYRI
jgi:hypothetical protein